jgi:hypothetical protein
MLSWRESARYARVTSADDHRRRMRIKCKLETFARADSACDDPVPAALAWSMAAYTKHHSTNLCSHELRNCNACRPTCKRDQRPCYSVAWVGATREDCVQAPI